MCRAMFGLACDKELTMKPTSGTFTLSEREEPHMLTQGEIIASRAFVSMNGFAL